jgi:hypothetical protein
MSSRSGYSANSGIARRSASSCTSSSNTPGIRAVLRDGGLFFIGVFGGDGHEGPLPDDDHEPPRFFSLRTDEQIQEFARESFEILDFHLTETGGWQFQSLTLRRVGGAVLP